METIEQLSARSETLSKLNGAMSALTTIDTSAWSDDQKLLLADVLWPLGELVDTVLEVPTDDSTCRHCGGPKEIRNPTGRCDHLMWPDLLTDEAKLANGFRQVTKTVTDWER